MRLTWYERKILAEARELAEAETPETIAQFYRKHRDQEVSDSWIIYAQKAGTLSTMAVCLVDMVEYLMEETAVLRKELELAESPRAEDRS